MNLNEKITRIFNENEVINKSLTRYSQHFNKFPSYVSDHIINKFVQKFGVENGLKQAQILIDNHFVSSDQKEKIKALIRSNSKHSFIGNISVRYDSTKNEFWSTIDVLGDKIRVAPTILNQYGDILLVRGCYGKICVSFDPSFTIGRSLFPFVISDFTPLQATNIDLDKWIEARQEFTVGEWIDLLVNSIGFDPNAFDEKTKMFYLCRLIPFVEPNINLVELGPVESGKTYCYRNLSNYGFVISGSNATVASLFYNKLRKQIGLIGCNDVILFDEISGVQFNNQQELINILKDYMNSGRFGRDKIDFASECSLVFAGNIVCDRNKKEVHGYYKHLFDPLPNAIKNDRAFLDRFHGYLPGWLAHQISSNILSQDIGFASDYLAEIFHRLRDKNYQNIIADRISFNSIGQRNEIAILKLSSGLFKLLYPGAINCPMDQDELKYILTIAIELRQRVIDQIHVISPGEFKKIKLIDQVEFMNEKK